MSSVTEQVKERVDLVSYVQQVVPGLKKAGRTYKACCPFHSEKTPSFVVNPDSQTWRCYGACAEGGDIFNFVMKLKGISFGEALEELAQQAGVMLKPKSAQTKQEDERLERLRALLQTAAEYYHRHLMSAAPDAQAAYQYARAQRGFSDETLARFLIGYAPAEWQQMLQALKQLGFAEADILAAGLASQNEQGRVYDRFRHRLMIPILDERGHITGFGARALDPADNPKYLNSPQSLLFDKSRTLFGLDKAKRSIQASGTAVIVEGYMDAIQAHQAGFTNVVAQMGTAMTEPQLKLLVPRYAQKIILALDADAAGQRATRRSLEVARTTLQADYAGRLGVDLRILHIDDAKDPDDVLRATPEKWPQYVEQARPVADFVIEMETATLSANATLQEKQQVARNVLPLLLASEDNLYKKNNLQKLALRLRLAEADVLAWAEDLRRKQDSAARPAAPGRPAPPPDLPPLPTEHSASSVEPPLDLPFDESWIPADSAEDDAGIALPRLHRPAPNPKLAAAPGTLPGFNIRHASREAERHCLRMLLIEPTLLYQINRRLRELRDQQPTPAEAAALLAAPLCELSGDDFSQSDYRAIFILFEAAIAQSDYEPLEYIRQQIESLLANELELLLLEEIEAINRRVAGRWKGEQYDVNKKFDKHRRPTIDMHADFMGRVLAVRLNRLNRERQDLSFLLQDAASTPDASMAHHQRVLTLSAAAGILQRALADLQWPLIL